ncbi:uncharacterized protein LOC116205909 [Punica granatum]|uniref:Uncharacterized protein LOC116205909 n=1 Tax=Punica granatum TaxID=22663 RepID=A0A6P8DD23_PUNGR|nr:uncharacterized protein LOC116205909 [Punica granatum]
MAESTLQSIAKVAQSLPQAVADEKLTSKGPLNWRKVFPKVNQSLEFFEGVEYCNVKPPTELLQIGVEQWCYTLVGRFLGRAPEFGKVAAVVNGLWGKQRKVVVSTMGSLFIFKFPNEDIMTWVLETGPWHVERKSLILQRWSPNFTEEELSLKRMPVWVQLRRIPLQYFHPKGISYLASAIGKPLYMDRATALSSRLDYAKVCVEVDAEKEIPNVLNVDLGNEYKVEVLVDTPWLPEKCARCKVFGHNYSSTLETAPPEVTEGSMAPADGSAAAKDPTVFKTDILRGPGMATSSRSDVVKVARNAELVTIVQLAAKKKTDNAINNSEELTSNIAIGCPVEEDDAGAARNDLNKGKNKVSTQGDFPQVDNKPTGIGLVGDQDNETNSDDDLEVMESRVKDSRQLRSTSMEVAKLVKRVQGKRKSRVGKGGWTAFSFIYASNDMREQRVLWHDLQALTGGMRHSWMLMGDFNAVKEIDEVKVVGREITIDQSMRDFTDFITSSELKDHPFTGCYFTWSNKRQEGFQARKIDRAMVNDKWFQQDLAS